MKICKEIKNVKTQKLEKVQVKNWVAVVTSFVPSAITQPFFELQTPYFAWKLV